MGWLSVAYEFPTGDFPQDLLSRLADLAENPVNRFRGKHDCDICPPPVEHKFVERPIDPQGVLSFKLSTSRSASYSDWTVSERTDWSVQIDGREIDVGDGEVQIAGERNSVYVAPTMILHYIVAHRYLPPEVFIQALRVGRRSNLPPEAFEV